MWNKWKWIKKVEAYLYQHSQTPSPPLWVVRQEWLIGSARRPLLDYAGPMTHSTGLCRHQNGLQKPQRATLKQRPVEWVVTTKQRPPHSPSNSVSGMASIWSPTGARVHVGQPTLWPHWTWPQNPPVVSDSQFEQSWPIPLILTKFLSLSICFLKLMLSEKNHMCQLCVQQQNCFCIYTHEALMHLLEM